jgi:basic membrane protein A
LFHITATWLPFARLDLDKETNEVFVVHGSMKKTIVFGLVAFALLMTGIAVAAHDASPSPGTPGAGEEVNKVAVIVPGSRTNQGWDQQAADGLEAVAEERGIDSEVVENAGSEDINPILRDLADGGAQLIICHGAEFQTQCPEFSADQQKRVAVIENPGAVNPLISDYETEAQDAAYLAGVLAAKMTKTGTVGIVVSGEPPTWNFMTVGFAEGLAATKPDAKLLYNVIGEAAYSDAAGAKRITEQQLAAGADIIFGMGDGASFGMVQAIEEHNEDLEDGANQAWFIDVIGDKSEEHGDVLLTSVLFDYTGVYDQMIDDIENGTFGQVYTMTLENNGVHLLDFPDAVPQDVKDLIEQTQHDIIDGKIKVDVIGGADETRAKLDELFPD